MKCQPFASIKRPLRHSTQASDPKTMPGKTAAEPRRSGQTLEEAGPKKFIQSDAGDGTTATQQYVHGFQLFSVLTSVVISLFVVALDQTIVSTLLTVISEEFNSFSKVGWLTSAFMLPMACLAPSYGKISIAFGRKYTMAVGLVIFGIGSLVCALANSIDMLIGGRVIQGLGGSAVQAMVQVIISESVPIDKRALAMSLIGVTFSVASVCGPFVGGAFTTHVTWRWCFYINIPLGAVALALLLLFFHPPRPHGNIRAKMASIDYLGTCLISAGLVLVLLAMTFGGNEYPWHSAAVICLFTIGGLMILLFTYYNFFIAKNPLILKQIIVVPQIVASTLSASLNFFFFMGVVNYLAIYFQVIYNQTAWESGIHMLPLVISVSVASAFNGIFIKFTYFIKVTMMMSGVLGPVGMGLLQLLGRDTPTSAQIGLLIPVGVSIGLQFQSSLLSAQLKAPGNVPGSMISVTIFLTFMRTVGGIIGVIASQLMLSSRGSRYLSEAMRNSASSSALNSIPAKALLQSPEAIWKLPTAEREIALDAFMKALSDVFYLNLAAAVLMLLATLFTTNQRIPRGDQIGYNEKSDNSEPDEKASDLSPESPGSGSAK